jgi:hypothetical protein
VDEDTARAAARLDRLAKGIHIGVGILTVFLIALAIFLVALYFFFSRLTGDSPA